MCAILTYAAKGNFAFSEDDPDAASITCSKNFLIEQILGCPSSAGDRTAINASLVRLSETGLSVIKRGDDEVLMKSMLRVGPSPDGSRKLHIQIPFEWVFLFKRGEWAVIHADVAHLDDLTGWLAYFYACHSQPYAVDVEKLKTLCGRENHRHNDFYAALKTSLDRLSSPHMPPDVRISSISYVQCGRRLKTIEVSLVAWDERKKAKTQLH